MIVSLKNDVIKNNNDTVLKIKKDYLILLKKYNKQFINILTSVVLEYIKGIDKKELEDWVDTYLSSSIKVKGIKKIEEIGNSLGGCVEKNSNINTFDDYANFVDNILNSNINKTMWLHNIASDFQSDFIKKLRNYYDNNKDKIEIRDFEKSLEIIRSELRNVLRRSCDNFLNEYKMILKRELLHNLALMKDRISCVEKDKEEKNVDSSLNDIFNKFSFVVEMFGYTLVIRNNKFFIRDNKNFEIEMIYDDNVLKENLKNMIQFVFESTNGIVWYIDRYKNILVRYMPNRIDFSEIGLEKSGIFSIMKTRDGVSYSYNDEVIESLNVMEKKVIMEKLPFIYELVSGWQQNNNNVLVKSKNLETSITY